MIRLLVDNIINHQKLNDDIKILLEECKRTKSYLYIFTKRVPYEKLTKFIENIFSKNMSKLIRFAYFFSKH